MSTERKTHNIKAVGLSFLRVLLRNIAWETAVQYLRESCSEEVEKEANLTVIFGWGIQSRIYIVKLLSLVQLFVTPWTVAY